MESNLRLGYIKSWLCSANAQHFKHGGYRNLDFPYAVLPRHKIRPTLYLHTGEFAVCNCSFSPFYLSNTYMAEDKHFEQDCVEQPFCSKGTYITGTSTTRKSIRECKPCLGNTYQDAAQPHRIAECTPQAKCGTGTFFIADSKEKERECKSCEEQPNTYQDSTEHRITECKPHTECGAGEKIQSATNSDKIELELLCSPCDDDEYQNSTAHRSTACTKHTPCPAGTYFFGLKKVQGQCIPCGAGTYQNEKDHLITACKPQHVCAAGEKITADSKTAKQQCVPCDEHTFQNTADHRNETCATQTTCGVGHFISPDSTMDARTCTPCPDNTFHPDDGHRVANCTVQTTCSAGQRISDDTKDAVRNTSAHRIQECVQQPTCPHWTDGVEYELSTGTSVTKLGECRPATCNGARDPPECNDYSRDSKYSRGACNEVLGRLK